MIVCLWSGKLGFESLSRNARPRAGFEDRAASGSQRETDTEPILSDRVGSNPRIHVASGRALDRLIFGVLSATIVALIIGLLVAPRSAQAHQPDPAACVAKWERADDGDRFAAKRACEARQDRHRLAHATAPCPVVGAITVKGARGDVDQRRNVTAALNAGRKRQVPRSHMVAIVAGATQEDSLRNDPRARDHDSVGFLQLRGFHGTHRQRMHIPYASDWFYDGLYRLDPHGRAPLRTTSRHRSGWGLIQRRQRSGHPFAYNQWIVEARRTVTTYTRGCR
jgi:hypothetical protein